MSRSLAHYQLGKATTAALAALESALEALNSVVEAEMAQLARRFPTRRLELHSGMGSTSLTISKRNPAGAWDDDWSWGPDAGYGTYHRWPEWLEEPAPELWAAIRQFGDELLGGKDPGFGTVVYDKGERIKGLR